MTIDAYNIAITYKIGGPKDCERTAVILQGWGTEMGMYDSVAAAIDDGYRTVQLDLPGFGASDEPREPWDVDAYTDFVCRFCEALGIKKAVLIGHSYGGRVIIKMAARAHESRLPFEIEKIVLIDSAGVMPERSLLQRLSVLRYKIKKRIVANRIVYPLFHEVIDYWMSKQGSDDYRNASPMMKKCLVLAVNEDLKDLMPKVTQETLLVWGDLDTDTPIGDAHTMEERMPNAALVVLEGTDHFSFLYKPVEFRKIIRAFLGLKDDPELSSDSKERVDEIKGGVS